MYNTASRRLENKEKRRNYRRQVLYSRVCYDVTNTGPKKSEFIKIIFLTTNQCIHLRFIFTCTRSTLNGINVVACTRHLLTATSSSVDITLCAYRAAAVVCENNNIQPASTADPSSWRRSRTAL